MVRIEPDDFFEIFLRFIVVEIVECLGAAAAERVKLSRARFQSANHRLGLLV